MTDTFYTTMNYGADYAVFGGDIDIEDFSTSEPSRQRIRKQAEAAGLNTKLALMAKETEEKEKYKSMTLEELKEMRLISNTDGRPLPSMTDEKWQMEFHVRKLLTEPYGRSIKKLGRRFSMESGKWNGETMGRYCGRTNWQEYCAYINDVLRNIRAGQTDYCYYIYHITDLLKFHHDDLRTRYCGGYWEVWLEK